MKELSSGFYVKQREFDEERIRGGRRCEERSDETSQSLIKRDFLALKNSSLIKP
jgi:hypothetical protein